MRNIELRDFINAPLSLIQQNEFVYFSLPTGSVAGNKTLVRNALQILTNKTTQLYVSLESPSDFSTFLELNQQALPPMIGVKLSIGAYKQFSRGNSTFFNDSHLETIENFHKLKKMTPANVLVIPEIDFSESDIQVGPTICELFDEFKLPFLFISIAGAPTNAKVAQIQKIFEYLRLRGLKKKIYFSFSNEYLEEWNIKTFNTFSGMRMVHIDLSNKCTHSCVFCGVWGPEFIDRVKSDAGGKIPPASVEFMNKQLPFEMANKILSELPETVSIVQFGGVGDPLTHPNWHEIVCSYRQKGIRVEILTNLDCVTLEQLEVLHSLSRAQYSMHLYVNVSAGNRKTYSIIRPRQNEQVFDHIMKNVKFLSDLKKRDGFGVDLTLLHVINKNNYLEMSEMVSLGNKYNTRVWLKPLEVHSEIHKQFEIPSAERAPYSESLKNAIILSKELDVELIHDSLNYFKGETIE